MKRLAGIFMAAAVAAICANAAQAAAMPALRVVDASGKPVEGAFLVGGRDHPAPGAAWKPNPATQLGQTGEDGRATISSRDYARDTYTVDVVLADKSRQEFHFDLSRPVAGEITLRLNENTAAAAPGSQAVWRENREVSMFVTDTQGNPAPDLVLEGTSENPAESANLRGKKTNARGGYNAGVLKSDARYTIRLSNTYASDSEEQFYPMTVDPMIDQAFGGRQMATFIWNGEMPEVSLAANKEKTVLTFKDASGEPVPGLYVRWTNAVGDKISDGYTDYAGKYILLGGFRGNYQVDASDLAGRRQTYSVDTTRGGDLRFTLVWS